ncbi:MAG: CTP synthase (glutamine hydrolyzing) [Nanoarchaeota archaeon]|nr:CTP synthase (glutamine hydrolyzing) [Nanoarchaeota archaeon]
MSQQKYIIVTGGVLSGIGKGIAAASIGHLLAGNGLKVLPIKCDGYLNVDPGTMNPIEHGEVYVLDDGGEVDMDFGHYERFLGCTSKITWNLTMGKVFDDVRIKERRGDYLGKTVQYIPHVTNAIKERFFTVAHEEQPDVILIEIGGTVGDMENDLYVEAIRQLKKDVGMENILYVHVTYVPIPSGVNEQKSKPTQQSVNLLRQRGIQPDVIIGRCREYLTPKIKNRISTFCDVPATAVITGKDVRNIYEVPFIFAQEGILNIINQKFGWHLEFKSPWGVYAQRLAKEQTPITIAICGKYTDLEDSYASVVEALKHAGTHLEATPKIKWVETTDIEEGILTVEQALQGIHGVIIPGGFGKRGAEGKIAVIKHCREKNLPFLGLCYGLQLAVIEYARNVCNLAKANSTEIDPETPHPVIDLLPEQQFVYNKGGTMRLGGHTIEIRPETHAATLFGGTVRLRFRHRYEVNPKYILGLEQAGLVFSGKAPGKEIMQILELPNHPFFMATQAHPELTSRLEQPDKLFYHFLQASMPKNLVPILERKIEE